MDDSVQETSVQEPQETYTNQTDVDAGIDFKVRKESSISHYEVSENGKSWWETIFYTENWGTFKSAVQRYCGFNCTPYKDKPKYLMRLLADIGVKAELAESNYKLLLKINKTDVRVDYAFKNRGRVSAAETSGSELGSEGDSIP
jgi:hypothetical protein